MKHIKYILIIIALIGLFSPIVQVNAADPSGLCTYKNPKGVAIGPFVSTELDCHTNPNASWVIDPKAGQLAPSFDAATNAAAGFTPPPTATQVVNQAAATPAPKAKDTNYHLLAPLPCTPGANGCDTSGKLTTFDPAQPNNLGAYLNIIIKIIIGICAVLSVVMIVIGGLEYMTSELISSKEEGKKRIMDALFGLILALGAYALLFTINPDLLNSGIKIPDATLTVPAVTAGTAPMGECNVVGLDSSLQTRVIFQGQTTEADCNAKSKPNGAANPHWTAVTTGNTTGTSGLTGGTATTTPQPQGTCSYSLSNNFPVKGTTTKTECDGLQGSWTANP